MEWDRASARTARPRSTHTDLADGPLFSAPSRSLYVMAARWPAPLPHRTTLTPSPAALRPLRLTIDYLGMWRPAQVTRRHSVL